MCKMFDARTLCGGSYFDWDVSEWEVGGRRIDEHVRVVGTSSITIWDVWKEHIQKGGRSINTTRRSFNE